MSVQSIPKNRFAIAGDTPPTPTPTLDVDAAIALKLKDDPRAASVELYERFAPDINRLVWRLLGADPDLNDIVQQVFYKVILHAHRLRDPSRLGAWVQSITV